MSDGEACYELTAVHMQPGQDEAAALAAAGEYLPEAATTEQRAAMARVADALEAELGAAAEREADALGLTLAYESPYVFVGLDAREADVTVAWESAWEALQAAERLLVVARVLRETGGFDVLDRQTGGRFDDGLPRGGVQALLDASVAAPAPAEEPRRRGPRPS